MEDADKTKKQLIYELRDMRQQAAKLRRFQGIVETTKNPVGLVDQHYVYKYVNRSYSAAFMKKKNEIIDCTVADLFGQEMFDNFLQPQYDRCFGGEEVAFQTWFEFPGWGRRYMDVRYYPYRKADGRVAAVVTNVHDITKFKQLEMELKDSEEIFRAFMDNNPAGVYIKDENDTLIYGNPEAIAKMGKKLDEFIGSTTRDLVPPEVATKLMEIDRKVLMGNMAQITEEWVHSIKGEDRWLKDIKFPLELGSGKKLLGGIAVDFTDSKRTVQELSDQLEFEHLVTDIAAKLAQAKPEQLEATLNSTLEALGRFLHTERSFLGQFSEDGSSLVFTNAWAVEGLSLRSQIFKLNMVSDIPWFAQQIRSGCVINAGAELAGLPDNAKQLRDQLERDGINSSLAVPIQIGGRSIGLLGLDTINEPRDYPQPIVNRLRAVADMIGVTLHRMEAQKNLQKAFTEINEMKRHLVQENIYLREEIAVKYKHEEIIGESEAIQKVLSQAEQVADTNTTVLILGETGTGKELLARAIHNISARKARTMVKVNCAALPPTLIESELFGREKGAYTGALTKQMGRFEVADDSTIFLDEISELPLQLQPKLLRVLQDGHFERLGSSKTIAVNVRLIAATNQNLSKAVQDGRFREDLYYRLNVFPIIMPPLCERQEDIPKLVWAFVKEFEKTMAKRIKTISRKSIEALQRYAWPGNVRELRNVIEQAMILSKDEVLNVRVPTLSDLVLEPEIKLVDVERNHILKVLQNTGWQIKGQNGAAKLLGLHPATLYSKMKRLEIQRPAY